MLIIRQHITSGIFQFAISGSGNSISHTRQTENIPPAVSVNSLSVATTSCFAYILHTFCSFSKQSICPKVLAPNSNQSMKPTNCF